MKYLPPSIMEELEDVKRSNQLKKDVDAFHEITKYCQVGREVERLMRFGIPKPKPFKKNNKGGMF